jgi:multisubunit Na+/H+ antiporter MnhB subunit
MTSPSPTARAAAGVAVAALATGLGVLLVSAMLALPTPETRLHAEVERSLPDSGVSHPVTAVLLNFRAYDTLLEIAVLAAALLAAVALAAGATEAEAAVGGAPTPVLQALPHVVVPIAVLTAAYLLWAGTKQPGGAFQAGAVLGGAGVMLHLAGWRSQLGPALARRAWLLLGFVVFLAVALGVAVPPRALLTYPPHLAGPLIFGVELTLTISIGLILATLFAVASGAGPASPERGGDVAGRDRDRPGGTPS